MASTLTFPRRHAVVYSAEAMLSLCGVVAPVVFAVGIVAAGRAYPGYSHASQAISELGGVGASMPGIQNANFALLGVLLLAFALGMRRHFNHSARTQWGIGLIATFALACVSNGWLPCDRGCDFVTATGTAHNLLGMTGFLALVGGVCVMARVFAGQREWADYRAYSRVTAGLGFVCLVLWIGVAKAAGIGAVNGVLQRLFVAVMLIWIEVVALRLYALSRRTQ